MTFSVRHMRGVMVVLVGVTMLLSLLSLLLIGNSAITTSQWGKVSRGNVTNPAPCRRRLQFAPVALPVTALASVQGSGNTWTRHLLQQLTGINTGSVYRVSRHFKRKLSAFYGEGIRNGSVVAVKTHGLPMSSFKRAVVIIRSPFDAMFADFNRRASLSSIGVARVPAFFHYWNNFSREYAKRWSVFYAAWIRFKGPVLFVTYDELVSSLGPTLEKLADFLKHSSLAMDVQCALNNSRGEAKRTEISMDKRKVFSKILTLYVNQRVEEVRGLMAARYPKLSRTISAWKRNETGLKDLMWIPLPPYIL